VTGEVDKFVVRCLYQIFSEFNVQKIIKISQLLTELFKKIKRWTFFEHSVHNKLLITHTVTVRHINYHYSQTENTTHTVLMMKFHMQNGNDKIYGIEC